VAQFTSQGQIKLEQLLIIFIAVWLCSVLIVLSQFWHGRLSLDSSTLPLTGYDMRGNTMLAINAILTGYGFFWVGFGQFHFLYFHQFALYFLLLSTEAYIQVNDISESSAYTGGVLA